MLWRKATWWCLPVMMSRTERCGSRPCTEPLDSPTNRSHRHRTKPWTTEEGPRNQHPPSVGSDSLWVCFYYLIKFNRNHMHKPRQCCVELHFQNIRSVQITCLCSHILFFCFDTMLQFFRLLLYSSCCERSFHHQMKSFTNKNISIKSRQ